MKIKDSSVYATFDKKEGKTYANVLVTVSTDSGNTMEIEVDIPTAVEDWDKTNFKGDVANKLKVCKPLTNTITDPPPPDISKWMDELVKEV